MPDNKAIVRDYLDRVWNQHDYTAIDDNIKLDFIQHSPNAPSGREGMRLFFRLANNAFSELKFTVEDMITEGDRVVWRWTLRGKHTGVFLGVPPTGRDFAISGISILRLEEGEFAELWAEPDMAGLMAQLK